MWNAKAWADLYGETPDDTNAVEYYSCDGCGDEQPKDCLHKRGKMYICDDCLKEMESE